MGEEDGAEGDGLEESNPSIRQRTILFSPAHLERTRSLYQATLLRVSRGVKSGKKKGLTNLQNLCG